MPDVEGEQADDDYPDDRPYQAGDVAGISDSFPPARPVEDRPAPYEFMAEIERAEEQVRIVQSRPQPLIGELPKRNTYQDQARRYFDAVHGPDWRYRAPEMFPNLVEQWIWAINADDPELAEAVMVRLEEMAADR